MWLHLKSRSLVIFHSPLNCFRDNWKGESVPLRPSSLLSLACWEPPSIRSLKSCRGSAPPWIGMPPAPLFRNANLASLPRCALPASIRPWPVRLPPRRSNLRSKPQTTPRPNGFSRPTPMPAAKSAGPESSPDGSPRFAWTASSAPGLIRSLKAMKRGGSWITRPPTPTMSTQPRLRSLFAPQLEAYAQVLRNLHGQDAVLRAALYYPRMMLLDWWEV